MSSKMSSKKSYIIIDTSHDPVKIMDYSFSEQDMIKSYVSLVMNDEINPDTIEIFVSYNMNNIKKETSYLI